MKIFITALFLLLNSSFATAAVIQALGDNPERCTLKLTGLIEKDDANQLRNAMREAQGIERSSYHSPRLCLESDGGNLPEALKMVDLLDQNVETLVPAHATCASSCAILFMSGARRLEGGVGVVPSRFMHVSSQLGFHAPSLIVADGAYTAAEIDKAYALSLRTIAELARRADELRISPSLLVEMLDTPPDEMRYISSVEDAVRWDILVYGVPTEFDVSAGLAMNACANATAELARGRAGDALTLSPFNANNEYSLSVSEGRISAEIIFGSGDGGQWQCRFGFRPDHDPFDLVDYDHFDGGVAEGKLTALHFYAPGTFLRSISLGAKPNTLQLENTSLATCFVYLENQQPDRQTCSLIESYHLDEELVSSVLQTFTWPDGERTVLTSVDGYVGLKINGAPLNQVFPEELSQNTKCFQSTKTNNTFCYALAVVE